MEQREATQTQFSNLLMRWFAYCERFTPRTQGQYKMVLTGFLTYVSTDIQNLKLEHIEKYLVHLHATGHCNRTINGHLIVIKSFCHWLRDYADIDIPTGKMKFLREDPAKQRIIDDEEYRKLLAACPPPIPRPMYSRVVRSMSPVWFDEDPRRIVWNDEDPEYTGTTRAIAQFTGGRMLLPNLIRLLKSDVSIRYMRKKGQESKTQKTVSKLKIHKEDFKQWVEMHYLTENQKQSDKSVRPLFTICLNRKADTITFLAHTGLREAEWRSLSWANISPDMRFLRIIGKGRKQRVVPLSETAKDILAKYKPDPAVKLSKKFFIYKTRGSLHRMLCIVAERAHIAPLGSHALRHYFATQLYLKGVPLHLISKVLGHADTRTTEKTYCHIWPEHDLLGLTNCLDVKGQSTGVILPGQSPKFGY